MGACIAIFSLSPDAFGQTRRRFEPTDLELQDEGTLEIDSQVSYTRGETAARVIVPDLEISLGLTTNVEIEVDAAYAIEGPPGARFSFDHPAPDNLWLSSKVMFADLRDPVKKSAWSFGAQFGPKVPLATGARGAGYEAVGLIARTVKQMHLVLNLGGYVDPAADASHRRRPLALEGGLDLALDLDQAGTWTILGELGVVGYLSGERHETHATAGLQWGPHPNLDLSLIGLVGISGGGDRGGILLGVTPRFALWK